MKLYAGIAAAFLLLIFYAYTLNVRLDAAQSQRDLQIEQRTQAEARTIAVTAELETERESRNQESRNRAEYLAQLRAAKNENDTLANDLADARKRLRIGAVCQDSVHETSDTGGTERKTAELDAVSERAYINHRDRIAEAEAWISNCHNTLLSWGK